jgi:hypothetical protein
VRVRQADAVALVPLVLIPALGAVQGGFPPDTWVWAGALAAWAAAIGIVLSNALRAPRAAWTWVAGLCGLLAWTILSTVWSVHRAQSVLDARRTLVYAAVALALVVLARAGATRILVLATEAAIAGVVVYALVRSLLGTRRYDPFEGYLLSQPLGYANAVGILAAGGILLGLGVAATASSRPLRAASAATIPPLVLALALTDSNASVLALAVGLATLLLLDPAPIAVVAALASAAPASLVVVGLGRHSGWTNVVVASPRVSGGVLVLVAAVCAAATAALAARTVVPASGAGNRRARRAVTIVVVAALLVGAAAAAHEGSREPRASYWHVAFHTEYLSHPALGSGAGTFGLYWARSGKEAAFAGALDAHSLYLETLAELGPLGLALVGFILVLPLAAGIARRRSPYVPVAAGTYVAFLLHAGLDWDWEMPAVVVAALSCGAALLFADGAPMRTLSRPPRAAALALALVLGVCAIAGARSHTVPAAAPKTAKAPLNGAFASVGVAAGYLPWPWPWLLPFP